jgi:hypothetical protein
VRKAVRLPIVLVQRQMAYYRIRFRIHTHTVIMIKDVCKDENTKMEQRA